MDNATYNYPIVSQDEILQARSAFFHDLVAEWLRPAEHIDQIMGQSDCLLVEDDRYPTINDPRRGLLAKPFRAPGAWGDCPSVIYSILHAGDWLRFGIMLSGSARAMSALQSNPEWALDMEKMWDRQADHSRRGDNLLIEWRFEEPNFYSGYIIRDRFVQMARHLHFQLGRAIASSAGHEPGGVDG